MFLATPTDQATQIQGPGLWAGQLYVPSAETLTCHLAASYLPNSRCAKGPSAQPTLSQNLHSLGVGIWVGRTRGPLFAGSSLSSLIFHSLGTAFPQPRESKLWPEGASLTPNSVPQLQPLAVLRS